MTETEFWELIQKSLADNADMDAQAENLRAILTSLPASEIAGYEKIFHQKHVHAYRWDLWAAAYLIGGGCGDDGFDYFRTWLISRGQEVYEAALASPDSLARLQSIECAEFEEFAYIPFEVYEKKTGQAMPRSPTSHPKDPTGENWNFDDEAEMKRRLPDLFKAYM